MATTSSSRFAYHVFLNFRGKDTRKTFSDHLYTYLLNARFRTFRDDDSIERGTYLDVELPKAIKQSRMSIVVLSENYASSTWCLKELVAILKCNKERGAAVLPVFYGVQPSKVRELEGNFKTEFETYENEVKAEGDHKRRTELAERVEEWKAALRQVAELTGLVYQADEPESKFIQKIVKVVRKKVRRIPLDVCPHPIGLDRRAQDINSWLQDESNDVPIVAICGIGGIGKTTIAKYLYNLNFERFEGSSFLASVREVSEQPDGLVRLQKQLLSDIFKGKNEEIYNADQGIVRIKEALRCIKVLVILDDVDREDQLYAVLGMRDWLYPGSKIIITTRRKQLPMASKFHTVHEVIEMNTSESLELFSWYAFGQDHPNEGYMGYSERVVDYCDGLPLALQVLGSSLSVKSIDVWESALQKLKAIPEGEILKKLQISYDSLKDDHDKNLFLDIACFFVGKDKDWTITVLDGCGFFTKDGIDNLINRCLLIDARDNKLWMHHHLIQEMGREIVRQESTEEPGGRSRLWQQEAFDVLSGNTGTEKIRGLILSIQKRKKSTSIETTTTYDWKYFGDKSSKQCHSGLLSWLPMYSAVVEKFFPKSDQLELQTSAFSRMSNLKLLQLSDIRLIGRYHEFPKIRWLCYDRFLSTTIPTDFPLQNLVVLEMRCSSLETFWIGTKPLISLKIIDLRGSQGLVSAILDFSLVPNLERLDLAYCTNLIEVHESIEYLRGLVLLDLDGCQNLRKFPANIHQLKSLKELNLSDCSKLHDESPASNTLALVTSHLKRWRKNPEPFRFSFPSSLVTLKLADCNLTDSCLPKDFGHCNLLEHLDLSENPICSLPGGIENLIRLKTLGLHRCRKIQSIPELPTSLEELDVSGCTSLHTMTNLPNLTTSLEFEVDECPELVEVQHLFKLRPIRNFGAEMINDLGLTDSDLTDLEPREMVNHLTRSDLKHRPLQGLYEFGIFSTYLFRRNGCEIPTWYSMKTKEPEISFIVSSTPNLKIRNFKMCLVYDLFVRGESTLYPKIKVTNKTNGWSWIYRPTCSVTPVIGEGDLTWLCCWNIANQIMKSGDEVRVSVSGYFKYNVLKEFGVHVVYEQEENGTQNGTNNQTVIDGGDLSAYQFRTEGCYYLCYADCESLWRFVEEEEEEDIIEEEEEEDIIEEEEEEEIIEEEEIRTNGFYNLHHEDHWDFNDRRGGKNF